MKRREFAGLAVLWRGLWQHVLRLTRKVARIGVVGSAADLSGPLPPNRTVRAFLHGMAELGHVYGRNFVSAPRGTEGTLPLPDGG